MSAEKLDLLVNEIGPLLLHNTSKSGALTLKQQLSVALHWLGCGAQYHIVGDAHGVDKSTVCRTVQRPLRVPKSPLALKAGPVKYEQEMLRRRFIANRSLHYFKIGIEARSGMQFRWAQVLHSQNFRKLRLRWKSLRI
ncbi:hypothetical protein Zmor_005744 [Zophobas morio]|uniref:Uncharacterized protein n=1 Tax=Zophobas morio TaxID=2755281 RepID=A0AA38ISH6_9CUCU|nr:hypothetical protein Zmor_005744 [Zophobas morio]